MPEDLALYLLLAERLVSSESPRDTITRADCESELARLALRPLEMVSVVRESERVATTPDLLARCRQFPGVFPNVFADSVQDVAMTVAIAEDIITKSGGLVTRATVTRQQIEEAQEELKSSNNFGVGHVASSLVRWPRADLTFLASQFTAIWPAGTLRIGTHPTSANTPAQPAAVDKPPHDPKLIIEFGTSYIGRCMDLIEAYKKEHDNKMPPLPPGYQKFVSLHITHSSSCTSA